MNDICRDTALVRMSDAAGFEGEGQKKRHDTRWLDEIVDEKTSVDDLRDILERGFFTCRIDDEGDIVVRDLVNFYIHPASDGLLLSAVFDFRAGVDLEAMHSVARATARSTTGFAAMSPRYAMRSQTIRPKPSLSTRCAPALQRCTQGA